MGIDYLVIGSGLSALTFAALAANQGRSVVVVEAHGKAGGFAHTFSYGKAPKQYHFNAQLHYVWNCGEGRTVNKVLKRLGLDESVTFQSYDPMGYDRMRIPGFALDIPYDLDLLGDRLAVLFPAKADECRAFLSTVRAVDDALEHLPNHPTPEMMLHPVRLATLLKWKKATLGDVFAHHGVPLEAAALLALQWPDFMLPPGRLSFLAWVMLFCGYSRGAYYPTNHFEHVVDSLVGKVREGGGEVRLMHRARAFILEGDAVVGAEIEEVDFDGRATGPSYELRAKHVVSNLDPRRTVEMVGPERFPTSVTHKLAYPRSTSNIMVYCAVEGLDLRALGFGKSNLFHAEHPDLDRAFDDMVVRGDYSKPSFAVTVPTLLSPVRTDCPEGTTIVEILTAADWGRWAALKHASARAYADSKKQVYEQLCDVIERDYIPGFREHVVFKLIGTPTTNHRYVSAPRGGSYGADMTPGQIVDRIGTHTGVKGLTMCNATTGYAGFAGTFWTGASTFEALEGVKVL